MTSIRAVCRNNKRNSGAFAGGRRQRPHAGGAAFKAGIGGAAFKAGIGGAAFQEDRSGVALSRTPPPRASQRCIIPPGNSSAVTAYERWSRQAPAMWM